MEQHDSEKDWQENCLFNFIFVYYCLFNSGIQLCSATITSGLTYNMIYVSPNTRLIFSANMFFSTVEPILYVLYTTVSAYSGIEHRNVVMYALTVRAATTELHLLHPKVLAMIAGYSINSSF
jgi:hypothetical protein